MDELLNVASHAATFATNFALKHSISFAGKLAVQQVSSYIKRASADDQSELESVKTQLLEMIRVVTPAIELIEIMSVGENENFKSTKQLVDSLHADIEQFTKHVLSAAHSEFPPSSEKETLQKNVDTSILREMKTLLLKINDAVPLLNLSITTSGASISSSLPKSTSFSQLLRANSYIYRANVAFTGNEPLQVGPTFFLRTYTIIDNHAKSGYISNDLVMWKEEMPVCIAKMFRMPPQRLKSKDTVLAYALSLKQSFDDDRYHDEDETPVTKTISLNDVRTLFFSLSGKLLRLDDVQTPVLLLKYADDETEYSSNTAPSNWIALEALPLASIPNESLDESDELAESLSDSEAARLQLLGIKKQESVAKKKSSFPSTIKDQPNLTLLEYLIRLCALESTTQESVLQLPDEQIALYLKDYQGRERPRDPASYNALENRSELSASPGSVSSSRHSGIFATPTFLSPWNIKNIPLVTPEVSTRQTKNVDEEDSALLMASPSVRKSNLLPQKDLISKDSVIKLKETPSVIPHSEPESSSKVINCQAKLNVEKEKKNQ